MGQGSLVFFPKEEFSMKMKVQLWLAGAMLAAVGGMVYLTNPSYAGGEKDPTAAVKKIADAIKAGKAADAKKIAEASAKHIEEVSDLMHLYRPRNKGGLGWGGKAGANPATDGLEKKIQEFAKAVPANVAGQTEANLEAAHWLAALSELTLAKTPAKDASGGKTKKAWIGFTEDMREGITAFTKAAEKKDGTAMAKAASKINSACVNCHSKFKE